MILVLGLLLLGSPLATLQEPTTEELQPVIEALELQVEDLQIAVSDREKAMLDLKQVAIEAQAGRLVTERVLWQGMRDALQAELSTSHGCTYDLTARACEAVDEPAEREDPEDPEEKD